MIPFFRLIPKVLLRAPIECSVGGSWHSSAGSCRVSIRYNDTPSSRFNYLGLRLVF